MNKIINRLNELEKETLLNLGSSKSTNTMRAYKSDFQDYESFCLKYNFQSLPSNPKIIALYLTELSKKYTYSTLKRRVASINVIHKIKGFHLDVKHPIVRENLLGIKRKIGIYQKSKKPLLINILYNIINYIDNLKVNNNLKLLRDRNIILIGFSGGFRRSEIVNLKYSDLEFVTEGVKITIRKSKSDQFGEGMVKAIPYFKELKYCPVLSLKKWISITNKSKENLIFPCSDRNVALILKKYLKFIGLDENAYSGHSLRSGFATSTAEMGADERSIMTMTGHKSTQMVRRYIKESNLFNNNALNQLKFSS
jgi:site-specific recombinase XerD